ncbi:Beta-glucosidase [Mesorhizobium ventifaucium]|uniref:Beta-glucosidase n=1 Tax=Mesorhizobium ventifaucium TaxID=666020 RepID=A0ABM9DWC7_9HYPH|nr:Beta-glucosidase [Mesorhizobium ventifaucium]
MLLNYFQTDTDPIAPFESNAPQSLQERLPLAGDRCSHFSSRQVQRTDPFGDISKGQTLLSTPHCRLRYTASRALRADRNWPSPDQGPNPSGRGSGGAHVVPVAIEKPPRIFIGRKHYDGPRPDEALAELLNTVQRQTLRFFWEFGHPTSGLARERSNTTPHVVTTGGSGFGIMAILAGVERGWIGRRAALDRLIKMVCFLGQAERHHGAFPHWMDGDSGRTIPFSQLDDGGDIVETAYLMVGLLSARQYFRGPDAKERVLRSLINALWSEVEWDWYTRGSEALVWHWSPVHGWAMDLPIHGWNECLIAFILAASAARHSIEPDVYHRGWAAGRAFANGRSIEGVRLPLGPDHGGPLFFSHYSFLGLDPRALRDRYADYWHQNVAYTHINRTHCVRNPGKFDGYGADCWGLTASDSIDGYVAHAPDRDLGVITPSGALGSFPYAPAECELALRHFASRGDRLWGEYGFRDAFSPSTGWCADSYLAIDQGPIVVMIENYRSGLLWRLFMSCPEIQIGLARLGFSRRPKAAAATS